MALVLADRGRAVDVAVDEQYPDLRMARPRRLTGGGFDAGNAAGQRADLGSPRVPTAARQSLPG